MVLSPGMRLGPYEVTALVGSGGMGEVYRARDTRLDRTVAIKVLAPDVAADSARRERFEREARAVAALNHPHICVLHDIGDAELPSPQPPAPGPRIQFLVMEYVEGETLAQHLTKGALPLEQALKYAIEIADALDKAHRHGIVHRDLKPGNIMITKPGAKLLDFGLAKLRPPVVGSARSALSAAPTEDSPATAQGTILGTLQYMAPEQLEGKEADARTDIFSFGAVLYETITGKKAFEGKSPASVIAAILDHEPPPIASLQPLAPPALDHVVRTCIAKDPDERRQSAHDLASELQWIADSASQTAGAAARVAPPTARQPLAWGVVGLIVGGVVATFALLLSRPPASVVPQSVVRFSIALNPTDRWVLASQLVTVSPDGQHLVYAANNQLHLRSMGALEATPIRGTDGGANLSPFFSPDGQWVGFFQRGQLKKVSISGGAVVTLCDARFLQGASWGPDDTIVFGQPEGIWRVSASGGTPQILIPLDTGKGDAEAYGPQVLPGGDAVLFTLRPKDAQWDDARIVVQSLSDGERRVLVEGGTDARYVSTGHLVYAREGNLLAAPFDPVEPKLPVVPERVLEGVAQQQATAAFGISSAGSLVYVPGSSGRPRSTVVWVDRQGRVEPLLETPRRYRVPWLSRDGRRLVVTIDEPPFDVWIYDLTRRVLSRLTFGTTIDQEALWTPDGTRVVFTSGATNDTVNLFWQPADGSGPAERLTTSPNRQVPYSWSPDGRTLAFFERAARTGWDIWLLPLAGDRKPEPFLQTSFDEVASVFSPDGRWIAYASDESSRSEIYVQPFPGPGGRWQISTEGGQSPRWAPTGSELFYLSGDRMMVAPVVTEPSFQVGTPRALFTHTDPVGIPRNYSVSADGARFVMLQPSEETMSPQMVVVTNWFEELKRVVPGR